MKVNRTYSMDYDLVIQLGKRVNQSDTVCKAVRSYLNGQRGFNLADVRTISLLASLQTRFGKGTAERQMVQAIIKLYQDSEAK